MTRFTISLNLKSPCFQEPEQAQSVAHFLHRLADEIERHGELGSGGSTHPEEAKPAATWKLS